MIGMSVYVVSSFGFLYGLYEPFVKSKVMAWAVMFSPSLLKA